MVVSLLIFCFAIQNRVNAQELNIATYNLRNANKDDSLDGNGWGKRFPIISEMVRVHDFDIMGTQEGKYHQLEDLKSKLDGYDYIGIGRDDGKKGGEFSAIFYKKSKLQLLNSGNFWMSMDTTKPNKGWDAVLPRLCTWGLFKDKHTGKSFYFYNLHMDHVGVVARSESAKLILEKMKERGLSIPVILTGDFNVNQNSESFLLLDNSGLLHDAYSLTPNRLANAATFNGFGKNLHQNERIDHIFLSPTFSIKRYAILTDGYVDTDIKPMMRYPSDHFPVAIKVVLK